MASTQITLLVSFTFLRYLRYLWAVSHTDLILRKSVVQSLSVSPHCLSQKDRPVIVSGLLKQKTKWIRWYQLLSWTKRLPPLRAPRRAELIEQDVVWWRGLLLKHLWWSFNACHHPGSMSNSAYLHSPYALFHFLFFSPSKSTNNKGQNQRLPKKDEDYRQNNADPLMAGIHHKSSITQGNSGESTRGCQDLRKASERQQRGYSYETEALDTPRTQK